MFTSDIYVVSMVEGIGQLVYIIRGRKIYLHFINNFLALNRIN